MEGVMNERGRLAQEARRIQAEHKVSLRQAYRYAATGRAPSACVRVGVDGRRYHVRSRGTAHDPVEVRRIRYTVAGVAKRANEHGISETDLAELERAAECIHELAASWRAWLAADGTKL